MIDRCNAYQKTTNKRPSNAINRSIVPRLNPSANTKLRRHKSSERIRDEFPIVRTVQTQGKTLKDAVQFYLNPLDSEAKRFQSLTGRPLARLTGLCTASPGSKPLTGSL